jgi:hypothetical protein
LSRYNHNRGLRRVVKSEVRHNAYPTAGSFTSHHAMDRPVFNLLIWHPEALAIKPAIRQSYFLPPT